MLQQFWAKNPASAGLRVGLVVGEAGVGKSRLLSRLLLQTAHSTVLTVHVKFSPESLTSPLRAIGRALESALQVHSIPHGQFRTLHDFAEGVPQLAQKHRLVVVIEDIHVLGQDGQNTFAQLLKFLGDSPITLLCLARPLPHSLLQILQPYLRLHLELHGLGTEEITELWKHLFAEHPDSLITDAIALSTLGNPLVIRSGLLRALQQGAIQPELRPAGITITINLPEFRTSLVASTQSLSEAMVQSLNPQQRQTLQMLASLGEVFAVEAACQIIPDVEDILQLLIRRGIIGHTYSAPPPLYPFSVSQHPLLTFTHTVLHRELLNSSTPNIEMLMAGVAARIPLYSVVPYSLIATKERNRYITNEVLEQAIAFTLRINAPLVESEDWQFSQALLAAAQRMMEWLTEPISHAFTQQHQIVLLMQQMEYATTLHDRQEYLQLLDKLLELTAQDLPAEIAPYRLAALSAQARQITIDQPQRRYELAKSLHHAVQQFTHQRDHVGYMIGLLTLYEFANIIGLTSMVRWVVSEIESIVQEYDLTIPEQKTRYIETLVFVINFYDNRKEFEGRLRLLEELEQSGETTTTLKAEQAYLLAFDGQIEKVHAIGEEILTQLRRINNYRHYLTMVTAEIIVWGMEGHSTREILEKFHKRIVGIPDFFPKHLNYSSIAMTAILGHNVESWDELEKEHSSIRAYSRKSVQIYIAACQDDAVMVKSLLLQNEELTYDNIVYWLLTTTEWNSAMESAVASALNRELVVVYDIFTLRCLIIGIEKMQNRTGLPFPNAVAEAASEGIIQGLEWFHQRKIITYLAALLHRFQHFLSATTVAAWEKNLAELSAAQGS
ncbi:MAG: AAA family ATPase [Armatimonadetes bacterium]|nr:AAA family ATPase [Armatimonadota bacterium]